MRKKLLAFVCLCIIIIYLDTTEARLSTVVKLPVTHNDYLCLIVGSPGKNMCFFIDHQCNETVILYEEPMFTSQTYTLYPATVLLHMGTSVHRFNAVFDKSLQNPTPYIDNEDGRICFGVMSQIWNHWTKATFSPDFIVLGEYDVSLTRETYRTFEFSFDKSYPTSVTIADAHYYLWYDTSTIYTYLPDDIFFNMSLLDLVFGADHHMHVAVDDADMTVQNPLSLFKHNTLRRNDSNDTVTFGRTFTRNFVIFYSAVNQTRWVRPAFDFFNYGLGRNVWVYTVGSLCNIFILFWVGKVLLHVGEKMSSYTFSILEIFIYTATLAVLLVEVLGYATQRFVGFYTETSNVTLFVLLIVFIMVNATFGLILTVTHWRTAHEIGLRRIPVETAAFMLLWLSQIHHVDEGINNIFLLFISSIYVVMRLLHVSLAFVQSRTKVFWFAFFYAGAAVAFFIIYNATPLIGLYFHDDSEQVSMVILILISFVCIPALHIFFYLTLTDLRRSLMHVNDSEYIQEIKKRL